MVYIYIYIYIYIKHVLWLCNIFGYMLYNM